MHAHALAQKPEVDVSCLLTLLLTLSFEAGLLCKPGHQFALLVGQCTLVPSLSAALQGRAAGVLRHIWLER